MASCISGSAYADTSHARIVRLSLVQGDVRFARDVKGDPLSDSSQVSWETAALNLPIRQGYVLATDNGRVEVEFENGALAFLAENTVLQFYDLSSEDGGLTTRLILRQGEGPAPHHRDHEQEQPRSEEGPERLAQSIPDPRDGLRRGCDHAETRPVAPSGLHPRAPSTSVGASLRTQITRQQTRIVARASTASSNHRSWGVNAPPAM